MLINFQWAKRLWKLPLKVRLMAGGATAVIIAGGVFGVLALKPAAPKLEEARHKTAGKQQSLTPGTQGTAPVATPDGSTSAAPTAAKNSKTTTSAPASTGSLVFSTGRIEVYKPFSYATTFTVSASDGAAISLPTTQPASFTFVLPSSRSGTFNTQYNGRFDTFNNAVADGTYTVHFTAHDQNSKTYQGSLQVVFHNDADFTSNVDINADTWTTTFDATMFRLSAHKDVASDPRTLYYTYSAPELNCGGGSSFYGATAQFSCSMADAGSVPNGVYEVKIIISNGSAEDHYTAFVTVNI